MEASDCVYGDYYRAGTPQLGQEKKVGGGDHFIVEELLVFSNEEEEEEEDNGGHGGDDGAFEMAMGNSTDSSTVTVVDSCQSSSGDGDLVPRPISDGGLTGELCVPHDDLAELEWLSHFVEESFSSEDPKKLQLIPGTKSVSVSGSGSSSTEIHYVEIPSSAAAGELTPQQPTPPLLPEASTVRGKARSKRSRVAASNWSSRLLALCPNTATSPTNSGPILLNPNHIKKSPKPIKKKEPGTLRPSLIPAADGRKCLHCATDKTPQWRTGPMGPKTLCNACGVRYKSGRLVPEYRPASSPTFILTKHSNSHRKVLELRRQKEMQHQHQHHFSNQSLANLAAMGAVAGEVKEEEFLIPQHLGPDFRQLI